MRPPQIGTTAHCENPLTEALQRYRELSPQVLLDLIVDEVLQLSNGEQHDDVTRQMQEQTSVPLFMREGIPQCIVEKER